MKTQSKLATSVGTLVCVLAGTAAAQHTRASDGSVDLSNDLRPEQPTFGDVGEIEEPPLGARPPAPNLANDLRPQPEAGIRDGPTVFVDLTAGDLIVEVVPYEGPDPLGAPPAEAPLNLRLAGGTPHEAGALVVSPVPRVPIKQSMLRADDELIAGTFGADGSFVVEVPPSPAPVFVRGVDFSRLETSGVLRVDPPLGPGEDFTWKAAELSNDVHRILIGLGDNVPLRTRFFGSASIGELRGPVDVTVDLAREKDSFGLYLGPELAQRTHLVEPGDNDGAEFHFRQAPDVTRAVETVIVLDTFSGIAGDLEWARLRLEALRTAARKGRSNTDVPHRLPLPAPTETVERTVELGPNFEPDVDADVGSVTEIPEQPRGVVPREGRSPSDVPTRLPAPAPGATVERKVDLALDNARRAVEDLEFVFSTLDALRSDLMQNSL